MKRLATLLLAAASCCLAAGQLQLFQAPQNGTEQLVTGSWELPSVQASDAGSVRFRIRNTGDAAVSLTALRVAGTGFSMTGQPSLPYIVAPGTNVDFTITFRAPDSGSYSANLLINTTGILLRATGIAAAAVYWNGAALLSDAAIDLGRIERGAETTSRFELRNGGRESVGVNSVSVEGAAFALVAASPAPVVLKSGETATFDVRFRPATSGILTGKLIVDRREFRLSATATEPPLPRPAVVLESSTLRSGQQGRLSIRLASPSKAIVKGRIRLDLRPHGDAKDNDGAVRFMAGGRSVDFEVKEGDSTVKFGADAELIYQTGTTAGTITFTVEAGGFTEQASLTVAPEAVMIDRSSAVRSGSNIEVRVSGFDNTRTVSEVAFTFYTKNGQPMSGMPIRVTATRDFATWWTSSTLGGMYALKASFPVTGDSTQVTAVEVQMTNASGSAKTERLNF